MSDFPVLTWCCRVGFGSGSVREVAARHHHHHHSCHLSHIGISQVVQPIRPAVGSAPPGRRIHADDQQQQQQHQQRRAVVHTQQAGPLSPVHKEVSLTRSSAILFLLDISSFFSIATIIPHYLPSSPPQIKRVGARVKDLASDVGELMQSLQVPAPLCRLHAPHSLHLSARAKACFSASTSLSPPFSTAGGNPSAPARMHHFDG
jgi:hypothetical protein